MKYFHLFLIPTCKVAHAHDIKVAQLKQKEARRMSEEGVSGLMEQT